MYAMTRETNPPYPSNSILKENIERDFPLKSYKSLTTYGELRKRYLKQSHKKIK